MSRGRERDLDIDTLVLEVSLTEEDAQRIKKTRSAALDLCARLVFAAIPLGLFFMNDQWVRYLLLALGLFLVTCCYRSAKWYYLRCFKKLTGLRVTYGIKRIRTEEIYDDGDAVFCEVHKAMEGMFFYRVEKDGSIVIQDFHFTRSIDPAILRSEENANTMRKWIEDLRERERKRYALLD